MTRDEMLAGGAEPAAARAERAPRKGHPVIATIIACFLIMLSSRPHPSPGADQTEMLIEFFGYLVAQVLTIWFVAWLITVRHASAIWHFASLAIVFLVAVLTDLAAFGAGLAASKGDVAEAQAQLKQALNGKPIQVNGNSGPLVRMGAAISNGGRDDVAAFNREVGTAGLVPILSLQGLTRSSPTLRHCERLDALEERARFYGGQLATRRAAAHAIGEEAVKAGQIGQMNLDAFEHGVAASSVHYLRQWELNAAISSQAADVCRLLHTRPWRIAGQIVQFRSRDDANRYNTSMGRIRSMNTEQDRLRQARQAAARDDIGSFGG